MITLYTTYMIVHVTDMYTAVFWWVLYELLLRVRPRKSFLVHFFFLKGVMVYHDG